MKIIDERLKLKTYMVGNSITAVDVILFIGLNKVKQYFFNLSHNFRDFEKDNKSLSCLKRWLSNLESIKDQIWGN